MEVSITKVLVWDRNKCLNIEVSFIIIMEVLYIEASLEILYIEASLEVLDMEVSL